MSASLNATSIHISCPVPYVTNTCVSRKCRKDLKMGGGLNTVFKHLVIWGRLEPFSPCGSYTPVYHILHKHAQCFRWLIVAYGWIKGLYVYIVLCHISLGTAA